MVARVKRQVGEVLSKPVDKISNLEGTGLARGVSGQGELAVPDVNVERERKILLKLLYALLECTR